MNRLLIISLLIFQNIFGQRQIQHEPERIFNKLIEGKSTTEYAKEMNLKKVIFYRDTILSSSIEFDQNGNFITTIGMENKAVQKSIYKWDELDRMVETKKYSPDGSFRYGYYYSYENGAKLMYKIEDSILFRKSTFLKGENISTYSEYDSIGNIILKNVYVKDSQMNWLLETRFKEDKITVQYRYEYLGDKKYVTKVQFDENGSKISEKRHLDEIKNDNRIEHYAEKDERLFRIDSLDANKNLIEMKLLDKEGNPTRTETFEYGSSGLPSKETKIDFRRNQTTTYVYTYDESNRIELVEKRFNEKTETFRYKYEKY